ncbi:MAG: LamG-like jellyroll fold domain-containing protein [Verrucomicrobiota bacterium]
MKTLLPRFHMLVVLAFGIFCSQAEPVATNGSGFQLTIELRDGSRVIGKTPNENLGFHSATLGDLKLTWADIRAIDYTAYTNTARLTATNGDEIHVKPDADTLRVATSFGKNEIPMKLIKSIKVSATTKPSQLPDGLVASWSGEGNAKDSVGSSNGTLTGSTTIGPGKVGQGFVFDGYNGSGVTLGNPASLQLQDFTIEAWIKRGSNTVVSYGSGGNASLFGCGWGGYSFCIMANGVLFFDKLGDISPQSGPEITDTNFHHVALTKAWARGRILSGWHGLSSPQLHDHIHLRQLNWIWLSAGQPRQQFSGDY